MPSDSELLTSREHGLPGVWGEGLSGLREQELRERWSAEHPRQDTADFDRWRASDPDGYKTWAEPHVEELLATHEQTLTDRLHALDVAQAEARAAGPAAPEEFEDQAARDLFQSLKRGEWSRPAVGDPAVQSMAVEVRNSAADLGTFAERLTELAGNSLIDVYVEHYPHPDKDFARVDAQQAFDPIKQKFDELRDALKRWNELTASAAEPKPAELENLARECRDKIEACRSALPYFGLDRLNRVQMTEVVVPAALDAVLSELARQWQARAGTPSFTNMAFRLSERGVGDKIAPDVDAKLKASGGDYRTVWSEGRDQLLSKLDRKTRNAVRSQLAQDLGPNLGKWKTQADALSSGKYSLVKMQESVLGVAYAADKYTATLDKLVSDPAVRAGFRDLLNGVQLQLRNEVAMYQKWLTTPKGAGA